MKPFRFVLKHLFYSILIISNFYLYVQAQDSADKRPPPNTSQLSALDQSFNSLNEEFRKLYREQTKAIMDEIPLILIVSGDSVTALSGQSRTVYLLPNIYTEIKASLHSVLGFQGLMVKLSGNVDDEQWQKAIQYSKYLGELLTLIPQTTAQQKTKQLTIEFVTLIKKATDEFIKQKQVNENQVHAVLTKVRPIILNVAKDIGQESAESLKAILVSIQAKTSKSDWNRTIAVIPGPITARLNNLNIAVTASVMGRELLGKRIFYSENVYDEAGIISYIEMLMRDKKLSVMLFDDPYRMWRDLLADTSTSIIETDFFTPLAK
ncbi:MAG: hypothetical protein Q7J51_01735 [Sheuella sp.]|nr:hypothetical protein [Sheuella sp.]